MAQPEIAEPSRQRLLTFSLPQLETDSESKQMERSERILGVISAAPPQGKLFKTSADIWKKRDEGAWRNEVDEVVIKDPATENGTQRNCCDPVWRCLGGKEVAEARWSLFLIIFDWVVDFAVGVNYFYSGQWPRAVLTYVIVFGGGTIVTFANFSPHELDCSEVASEIWKMSKFFGLLMYIPSFYPICTTKLLLHYVKKLALVQDDESRKELSRKHKIVEEKALWDMSCESTFEAVPQAVLQIILVFDQFTQSQRTNNTDDSDTTSTTVASVLGFLPVLSILLSVYGISMAPITVIRSRSSDFVIKFGERLAAFSTQALRVFCCALFVIACRILVNTESRLMDTLWSALWAILVFSIFDVPYIIRHEIEKRNPRSDLLTINTIIDTVFFLATLGAFQLWIISWLDLVFEFRTLFIITATIYAILMALTYTGLFCYRNISVTYRDVAASVIVYAYDAAKRWILSVFGILLKRDRSIGPVA